MNRSTFTNLIIMHEQGIKTANPGIDCKGWT